MKQHRWKGFAQEKALCEERHTFAAAAAIADE